MWLAYGYGRSRKISATTPPPPPPLNLPGLWRSRKISATTPPPPNLVGLRRDHGKMAPPKKKSWLRRWEEEEEVANGGGHSCRCRDKFLPVVKFFPPPVTLPYHGHTRVDSDGNSQVSASTTWLTLAEPTYNMWTLMYLNLTFIN